MNIAFLAQEANWDCVLDSRFGRASSIVIFDSEKNTLEIRDNTRNAELGHGAGIQTAQALVEAGVSAVIAVSLGPKAFAILREATIPAYYASQTMTIRTAWKAYQEKQLEYVETPNR